MGATLTVVVLIAVLGAAVGAIAENCAFTLSATPSSANPDGTVTLYADCLHDAYGNTIPNYTVEFYVTPPGGTAQLAGTAVTDANGDAQLDVTSTSAYGTYGATASAGAASASTTFAVAPGAPAGTFTVVATAAGAGADVALAASGIVDANGKPVANGTEVTFLVSGPSGDSTYTGTTTGVSSSTDTATASATVPGSATQSSGTYSVTASAGDALGTTSFTIDPAAIASLVAVAPTSVVQIPATGVELGVTDATDGYGNVASNATVELRLTDPLGASAIVGTCTTNELGACSLLANLDGADQPYGQYTLEAGAPAGAALSSATFDAAPGEPEAIGSIATSAASAQAGTSMTVTVNDILAPGIAAAATGTEVTFTVVGPTATRTYTSTVEGVDSRADSASAAVIIPGDDNTKKGIYTVTATAGTATAGTSYEILPGPPVPDMTVTADDVPVGDAAIVDVTLIPAEVVTIDLIGTRPDNSTFTITVSAPCDEATGVCDFGGATSIDVPASEIPSVGAYGLNTVGKSSTGEAIAGGAGLLKVLGSMTVIAPDAGPNADHVVTVSNVPSLATSVRLVVQKPSGATATVTGTVDSETQTSAVTIPASALDELGVYVLNAAALDADGNTIGSGVGSLTVKAFASINVVANPGLILPGGQVQIVATALDPSGNGAPDRELNFIVRNPIGEVILDQTKTTSSAGKADVIVGSLVTLIPGEYVVTVTDLESGTTGGTVFRVLV